MYVWKSVLLSVSAFESILKVCVSVPWSVYACYNDSVEPRCVADCLNSLYHPMVCALRSRLSSFTITSPRQWLRSKPLCFSLIKIWNIYNKNHILMFAYSLFLTQLPASNYHFILMSNKYFLNYFLNILNNHNLFWSKLRIFICSTL